MQVSPVFIFIILIIAVAFTLYFFIRARHDERMAMIEKGTLAEDKKVSSPNFIGIKIGMLFFGVGVGLIAAYILSQFPGRDHEALYPALMFLFGGASLVSSYFVEMRIGRKIED
ncbi:MAG: hypothetical protein H6563_14290 [Lewinellaceae bacterium]|nr:hypothetical protein [Lewinellaceae bacterium]